MIYSFILSYVFKRKCKTGQRLIILYLAWRLLVKIFVQQCFTGSFKNLFVLFNRVKKKKNTAFFCFKKQQSFHFSQISVQNMWLIQSHKISQHRYRSPKDVNISIKWLDSFWMKPELSHCSCLLKQKNNLRLLMIIWVICDIYMIT